MQAGGLSLAVLVGGSSRRMGRDKARILVGGVPLAGRPAGLLAGMVDEVILAGRPVPGVEGRAVADAAGVPGPLGGALAALRAAACELVAVVPCDAPELVPELITLFRDALLADARALVALGTGPRGPEPLPAVVRRGAVAALEVAAARGITALGEAWALAGVVALDEATCRSVDPGLRSFASWNTPEQLRCLAAPQPES